MCDLPAEKNGAGGAELQHLPPARVGMTYSVTVHYIPVIPAVAPGDGLPVGVTVAAGDAVTEGDGDGTVPTWTDPDIAAAPWIEQW